MIVLASASPRRRELLALITKDFTAIEVKVDEQTDIEHPGQRTEYLAQLKARAGLQQHPACTIIGADTLVYAQGQILGKPVDRQDAERMIHLLAGRTHTVYTGICLLNKETIRHNYTATEVEFAPMSDEEIQQYVMTKEIMDKAGAYGIQSGASKYIKGINGCFFNVMGLPVQKLYQMLHNFG